MDEENYEQDLPSLRPFVIALIAAIVLAVAYPKIKVIVDRWSTPPPPAIAYLSMPKSCAAFMVVDKPNSVLVQYLMVVGGDDWKKAVLNHQVPPRCRNVPLGQGCIDWLEEGESDWVEILKDRPKQK